MKKAKKRTKAQRSAAAKLAWEKRRAAAAAQVEHNTAIPPAAPAFEQATPHTSRSPLFGLVEGYGTLHRELMEAYEQSAYGKGKERHANGRPFDRQPILENGRMFGPGFTAGQAAKKAQEALGMLKREQKDAAIAELHGAIVYLAATAALIRES